MKTLTLQNRFQGNCTIVENDFIDYYMIKSNGEYVKVYLLLLRFLNVPDAALTLSKFADTLECTEKDIIRAFNHWAKMGLLKIDYDESGTICGLTAGKFSDSDKQEQNAPNSAADFDAPSSAFAFHTSESESVPVPAAKLSEKKPVQKQKSKFDAAARETAVQNRTVSEHQEQLRQLYFVAEQYIGKPLSHTDIKKINYFFDSLHFSTDLIEYLIEYCVENGHRSMRYIESVALAWSDAKITNAAEAKTRCTTYNKNCYTILNAFGIKGRNPAPFELEYIKKWTLEYGISLDIIVEACNRTIANAHKPDFKYADSILRNWIAKDVHYLSDIARIDAAFRQTKEESRRSSSKPAASAPNRFNNFEGRSYDISSLERQLLNTQ